MTQSPKSSRAREVFEKPKREGGGRKRPSSQSTSDRGKSLGDEADLDDGDADVDDGPLPTKRQRTTRALSSPSWSGSDDLEAPLTYGVLDKKNASLDDPDDLDALLAQIHSTLR